MRLSRPCWLVCSVALCAVLLAGCGAEEPEGATELEAPFNVILVSLDTLRADRLGGHDYGRETSPAMDTLMDVSVTFDHAIAHAPHTNPSHKALFQSRLPSQTSDDQTMLAEVFAEEGYRTVAFTGGGHVSAKFGFSRGFERYEEDLRGFSSTFDEIEGWVRNNVDRPFFLFLHSYDIHLPYNPPEPFHSMFTSSDYEGPVQGDTTRDLAHKVRRRKAYKDLTGPVVVPEVDRKQFSDLYDGGIRYTDQYIARLVSLLRSLDLWDRSILVVFSDHGEEFWDHGSVSHGHTLYQELIHVPLTIRIPGVEGRRVAASVGLLDIAPTILDLLSIPEPESFLGESLLPTGDGGVIEDRDPVSEIGRWRSIVRYPWKLIIDQKSGESKFFNLEADPGEQAAIEVESVEEGIDLRNRLIQLLAEADDLDLDVDAIADAVEDEELREQLRALGYIE